METDAPAAVYPINTAVINIEDNPIEITNKPNTQMCLTAMKSWMRLAIRIWKTHFYVELVVIPDRTPETVTKAVNQQPIEQSSDILDHFLILQL